MNATRLSICIATLNRRDFIGETLANVMAQMTPAVELVVVDGASTDGTSEIVAEAFRGRGDCRHIRLDAKGGVDRDYDRAVQEARGEYCWLMTDDDLLRPGAIDDVLARLNDGLDLIVVNAEVDNADFSQVLIPRKCPATADRVFSPDETAALLAAAGDLLSFIGSVVIRRDVWLNRDRASYFGTEFVHVGVIFQKPLERGAALLTEPRIRIRYGNAQWTSRTFEIWMLKWPRLIWSFAEIGDEAKRSVTPREPWRDFNRLMMMKSRGSFDYATYRRHLAPLDLGPSLRLRAWLLAIFPDVLYNAAMCLLVAPLMTWDKNVKVELSKSPYYYRKRWFGKA